MTTMYTFDVSAVTRVLLPSGWHSVEFRTDEGRLTSTFVVGGYAVSWQGDPVHQEDSGFAFNDEDTGEAIFGPLSAIQAVAADPDLLRAARSNDGTEGR